MEELYLIQGQTLVGIADAVRTKTGETGSIPIPQIREKILSIETNPGDPVEIATPNIEVSPEGVIKATSEQTAGYVEGGTKQSTKQLNTVGATTVTPGADEQTVVAAGTFAIGDIKVAAIETVDQAIPSIQVSSTGLVTAISTQKSGYVETGMKYQTKQLPTAEGTTITPGTSEQIAISEGTYAIGDIKVAGDENLKAENILNGVSIFGVTGIATNGTDSPSAPESSDGYKIAIGDFNAATMSSNAAWSYTLESNQTIYGIVLQSKISTTLANKQGLISAYVFSTESPITSGKYNACWTPLEYDQWIYYAESLNVSIIGNYLYIQPEGGWLPAFYEFIVVYK